VISILVIFVNLFKKSRDENAQNAEAEKKKLEKEKEQGKCSWQMRHLLETIAMPNFYLREAAFRCRSPKPAFSFQYMQISQELSNLVPFVIW
jgi:hypothetical protein